MTQDFSDLSNPTFLQACAGLATPYTPVWLMRQAGRYLPEYRASRAKAGSFMGLATSPEMATEVTLQPLDRYALDAAILFSDILTVPDAMGLGLSFAQGEGPRFAHPLRDEAQVKKLAVPDMNKLKYVFDAVASIRRALLNTGHAGKQRVPLIGFSGSPWTLACYMVEGGGSDDFRLVKSMMYARPDLMHHILQINAQAVAQYLNAQIDAGAQAVMLFDSWGGALSERAFHEFSLNYMREVLLNLKRTDAAGRNIPRIVFTKGGGLWLHAMKDLPCEVIGLDWTCSLSTARQALAGSGKALQGNIDPAILMSDAPAIEREVQAVLDDFGAPHTAPGLGNTHIFNLGHGINQHTPEIHVQVLVDAVKTFSCRMRRAQCTNA